eukprot:3936468-Rhodomonas_salina.1
MTPIHGACFFGRVNLLTGSSNTILAEPNSHVIGARVRVSGCNSQQLRNSKSCCFGSVSRTKRGFRVCAAVQYTEPNSRTVPAKQLVLGYFTSTATSSSICARNPTQDEKDDFASE